MNKITYVFWMNEDIEYKWADLYNDVKDLFKALGYEVSHLGIVSDSFNSGKVVTVNRKEKEVIKKLIDGERPLSFTWLSIPKSYKNATSDCDLMCCIRGGAFFSLEIKSEDNSSYVEKLIISFVQKHFSCDSGEAFTVDRKESSLVYCATKDSANLKEYACIKQYHGLSIAGV